MKEMKLMDRAQAVTELNARLKTKNLIKHSLAVEAIMRRLALHLGENEQDWGLAGLMHDIDYDRTSDDPAMHSIMGAEILGNLGVEEEIIYAVKAHNEVHGLPRHRKIDKALFCSDPVSGLITAGALILPSKKLADVDVEFLLKRMNEKSFAKGANREQIKSCSDLDLELEKFMELSLEAMKGISDELGL